MFAKFIARLFAPLFTSPEFVAAVANAVAVASRTFDDGDVVIPCIHLVATGAGQPAVVIHELTCGVA
jgi:hypothetical protein